MEKLYLDSKDIKRAFKASNLYVIPVGGCGMFGMNMTCYILDGKMIIVDAGSLFPEPWMIGISLVIPSPDFWLFSQFELLAYFITHAHEDHIGALPFLLKTRPAPIYTTEWTSEIIKRKLSEQVIDSNIISVAGGASIALGRFSVKFLPIGHSIPDAVCFLIKAAEYRAFHSGDFKFDQEDESIPASLKDLKTEAVDLFLCDSTNAEKDGICPQEISVCEPLKKLIGEAKGNVYLASFSSNLMRFKWIAEICRDLNRKLYLSGASIRNNFELAKKLGIVGDGDYREEIEAAPVLKKSVIIISGCQGEYRSALARLANNEHRFFQIQEHDIVVFSSRTIPGNEKNIADIVDKLRRLDAKIVTVKENPGIHVSGHCYGGEVSKLLEFARPKTFIPVHGTHSQQIANKRRNPFDNTLIVENGAVIERSSGETKVIGRIKIDTVFVDEEYELLLSRSELLERLRMAKKGVAFLSGLISIKHRKWVRGPVLRVSGLIRDDQWLRDTSEDLSHFLQSDDLRVENSQEFVMNALKAFWENVLIERFGRKPITYTDIWSAD